MKRHFATDRIKNDLSHGLTQMNLPTGQAGTNLPLGRKTSAKKINKTVQLTSYSAPHKYFLKAVTKH